MATAGLGTETVNPGNGKRGPKGKLTPAQVQEIRAAVDVPARELAARYGVSAGVISRARRGETHRQVPRVALAQVITRPATKTASPRASFSLELADLAQDLLGQARRSVDELKQIDDPKYRAQRISVIARSLRDMAEAKESLLEPEALAGMSEEEIIAALEARVSAAKGK